jgi:flagellar biosynthesis/type III secretory pathway protein FliH
MAYTSPEVEERVMEDIVDRLRVLNFMGPWKEAADEIEKLRKELEELSENIGLQRDDAWDDGFAHGFSRGEDEGLQIVREIYEVYAGSEGIPQPMSAAEGYLLSLLMEVVKIAQKALKEKE